MEWCWSAAYIVVISFIISCNPKNAKIMGIKIFNSWLIVSFVLNTAAQLTNGLIIKNKNTIIKLIVPIVK